MIAACVGFDAWTDTAPLLEKVIRSAAPAAAYEPGQFARRELPYLLEVLACLDALPDVVVVDGYVWLDAHKPGLGARLFEALEGRVPVIGVAKTRFHGADDATSVLRGKSKAPLFVSAAGMDLEAAVGAIAQMAGPHRVPTLLKRVDLLSRTP